MTYVKICGIREPRHAVIAADAGADMIGVILAESRRQVTPEEARSIVEALPGRPATTSLSGASFDPPPDDVPGWFAYSSRLFEADLAARRPLVAGVFVSAAAWIVNELADQIGLDVSQQSGDDPWHYCLEISRPTIKAVHVREGDDAASVMGRMEPGMADLVLLDSRAGDRLGGTGQTFDWSIAAEISRQMPIILAGGLTPDNVGEAVRVVRPFAVDVSSGVETDGVKDPDKIRAFIQAVRTADSEVAAHAG